MKRYIIGIAAVIASVGLLPGCEQQYTTYDGPAYVMFADTLSVCPALEDGKEFPITIASLQKCDFDRTYGLEVIAQNSDAVYNWHYTLDSQTITIPAGETSASVHVRPIYENLSDDETPVFALRLVSQFDDAWSEEGKSTKVKIKKVCPFDIHNFEGYCRLTSAFHAEFGLPVQRVFTCEVVEGEENTLLMRDLYFDNYDIKVRFDDSDPLNPTITMCGEQVIADTREAFGNLFGDNQILADNAPGYVSSFNSCKRTATMHLLLRVDKVAPVGIYLNLFTWIKEHEIE